MMTVRDLCALLQVSTLPQKASREEWGEATEAMAMLYDVLWKHCRWVSVEVVNVTDTQAVMEVLEKQVASLAKRGACEADCKAAREGLLSLRQNFAGQGPAPPTAA